MKETFIKIIIIVVAIIIGALLLGGIGFGIYIRVKYANVPISELPSWVFWILYSSR